MDNEQSKISLLPFMLIHTDGYCIATSRFPDYNSAYETMKAEYNECNRNKPGDECDELSYLSEYDAQLYDCGENVYIWRIENLND